MWLGIFLVGSFWFWLLVGIETLFLFGAISANRGWPAGWSLLIFVLALWTLGDFNSFRWIYDNPVELLKYAGGYVALGVIWSLIKFKLICIDIKDAYVEIKSNFFQLHNIDAVPPNHPKEQEFVHRGQAREDNKESLHDKWIYALNEQTWPGPNDYTWRSRRKIYATHDVIPLASEYKDYIMCWGAYWPVSLLWFVLHDFVERTFRAIYEQISHWYQNIANATFASLKDDFKKDAK